MRSRASSAGGPKEEFLVDDLLRSAVLHKLTVIGEAAARLPRAFCEKYLDIPWADIVAFRNLVVHSYFAVDWEIVWIAGTEEAPALGRQVKAILDREFPEE